MLCNMSPVHVRSAFSKRADHISILAFLSALVKGKHFPPAAVIFFPNVFIHLGLDTIVGKVRWLAPFFSRDFVLFEVPARYNWWVWNFVFNWTILFEITIVSAAVVMFLISRRTRGGEKSSQERLDQPGATKEVLPS